MAKRKVNRIEIDKGAGAEGSLTHNPFAALKSSDAGAPVEGIPLSETPAQDDASARPISLADAAPVVVRHERKGHGGKTVTVADLGRIDPKVRPDLTLLARDAAKGLGTGARVVGESLVLQGDVVERLAAFLTKELGAKIVRGTQR